MFAFFESFNLLIIGKILASLKSAWILLMTLSRVGFQSVSSKADQMYLLVTMLSLSLITPVQTRLISSSIICTRDSYYCPSSYPILSLLSEAAGLASSNTRQMCRTSPSLSVGCALFILPAGHYHPKTLMPKAAAMKTAKPWATWAGIAATI